MCVCLSWYVVYRTYSITLNYMCAVTLDLPLVQGHHMVFSIIFVQFSRTNFNLINTQHVLSVKKARRLQKPSLCAMAVVDFVCGVVMQPVQIDTPKGHNFVSFPSARSRCSMEPVFPEQVQCKHVADLSGWWKCILLYMTCS